MDQISNSKRTEEEKEKGKTEKPLRGLYVLYTVVSKEESHSRVLMILIVGMNLSVLLRNPFEKCEKKSIEISFLFICLKVENEVKKLLQLF